MLFAAASVPGADTALTLTDVVPAIIGASVAITVYSLGELRKERAARLERQRTVLTSWVKQVSAWVESARKSSRVRAKPVADFTWYNRSVIELNFSRRDRFVAWWMHSVGLIIVDAAKAPGRGKQLAQTFDEIDDVLTTAAERLLSWQHGELKSRDFWISFALFAGASKRSISPDAFATRLGLEDYLWPRRMTLKHDIRVVRAAKTNYEIGRAVGTLIGLRARIFVVSLLLAKASVLRTKLFLLKCQHKMKIFFIHVVHVVPTLFLRIEEKVVYWKLRRAIRRARREGMDEAYLAAKLEEAGLTRAL